MTTIPSWIPKYIKQVVDFRERQAVTHTRINELYNLLITQGDFNTETLQTLIDNLDAFDTQYLADAGANTTAHQNLLDNFTNTVNQLKAENADTLAQMDTQQRQLMADQLLVFQTNLATTEQEIDTLMATKLAEVQTLVDTATAQYSDNSAEMEALTTTVNNLRADILADNQVIADQVEATKLYIDQRLNAASEVIADAEQIYDTLDEMQLSVANANTTATDAANTVATASFLEKASGTATAITLTNMQNTDGFFKQFIVTANNNGAATTINGEPLYKANTTTAPTLKAGKAVMVWWDATQQCFFLKASATGDAVAANVLAGKTFSNENDTDIVGTIPVYTPGQNVPASSIYAEPGRLYMSPGLGKYFDDGAVYKDDPDFVAANFLNTANVFGVQGAITRHNSDGNGYYNLTPLSNLAWASNGRLHFPLHAGAYLDLVAGQNRPFGYIDDPDYKPEHILSTANIFGMQGSVPVKFADLADSIGAISIGRYSGWDGNLYAIMQIPVNTMISGAGWVRKHEPDMIPQNVLKGKTIWGMPGEAPRVVTGQSYVGGTATFTLGDSKTQNGYGYIDIPALPFKPRAIVARWVGDEYEKISYVENATTPGRICIHLSYGGGINTKEFDTNSAAYVSAAGSRLPSPLPWTDRLFTWVAYET